MTKPKDEWMLGKRVELIRCDDEFTELTPGSTGTIDFVDDLGTVFVKWDSGSTLGLVPGVDLYRVTS